MNEPQALLFNPLVLLERLTTIETQNAQILELLNAKKYVTMQDVAQAQGVGLNKLRAEPWRMPMFGKADEGSRPKKWYTETYQRWNDVPMEEHKARWFSMDPDERKKCLGIEEAV